MSVFRNPPSPRTTTPDEARQKLGKSAYADLASGKHVVITQTREQPAKSSAAQNIRANDQAMNARAAKSERDALAEAFKAKAISDRDQGRGR